MEPDGGNFSSRESTMDFAHSPEFSESQSATCSSNNFSRVPQIITRARRRDNCSHDCNSHHHYQSGITILSSSSFYPLVFLTSLLLLCLVPLPVHSLPLEGSVLSSGGGSSSSSHRSHLDLLIDPIHQAEFGEDELESKNWVARSVFDMVLRTPPPPTSSASRCPPGTQSPFEGGPCIKKSTDPVAFVDQTFLLDTLRGLAKEGTLLSGGGGSRTKRPGGGGGGRRRPSISGRPATRTSTTTSTLPPPTMPSTTESAAVAQTTFINPGDISDSEVVTQVPSIVPGKNPSRNRNPEEQTTFPTTQLTSPLPEEDSSNFDNSVTATTMTSIRTDPAQELKRQDENRNGNNNANLNNQDSPSLPYLTSSSSEDLSYNERDTRGASSLRSYHPSLQVQTNQIAKRRFRNANTGSRRALP